MDMVHCFLFKGFVNEMKNVYFRPCLCQNFAFMLIEKEIIILFLTLLLIWYPATVSVVKISVGFKDKDKSCPKERKLKKNDLNKNKKCISWKFPQYQFINEWAREILAKIL